MPLSGFLSLPRKGRRVRSKDRNEAGTVEDPSGVGQVVPHPAEQGQDLGTGSSSPPTTVPLNSKNHVPSGM